MSRFSSALPILVAGLAAAALAGCGAGSDADSAASAAADSVAGSVADSAADRHAREEPFVVRPFDPRSGGRWIGNAVCYGPHRDGQRPGERSPSAAELRQDLRLMAPHWALLRIYGSSEFAETLLAVIRDRGFEMKVMLGVWIAPDDPAGNRREVDAALRLAAAYPDVVLAISVGNETQVSWSAHRSPLDDLIAHVRRVRAGVRVPVTAADDFAFWDRVESRRLAAEVDFLTVHAHPMWNGLQLEDAVAWLRARAAAVQARHPERAVVIGETGWATSVHDRGEQAELIRGRPGEIEQKLFHDAVRAWAANEQMTVFYFEAFDENWKGGSHPDEVEKHWGLFRADREAKAAIRSPAR
ncbi:MAG: glycosyl hydrolase family 17 protein [Candidatus Krumholzibacteriia bacterium]